jgi:hypothetical protein
MNERDVEHGSGPGTDAVGTPVVPDPGGPKPQPEHPEVGHEHSDVNIRAILWTAGIMVAVAAVLHLVIWWLFVAFQKRELAQFRPDTNPQLAEENRLPASALVPTIPGPLLEGIDARATQLLLKTDEGQELLLDVPPTALVELRGEAVPPFDLPVGAEAAVVYEVRGGRNRVTSITSPAPGHEEELRYQRDKRTARGKIVHVEPKDIADRRAWSEARLARLRIDDTLRALADEKGKLRAEYLKVQEGVKGGGDSGRAAPTRSNSGPGPTGDKQ